MANNPILMSMPICRDAEKNTIPATDNGTTGKFSEQYGWQGINSLPLSAGGKAVERLDFNGVLGLLGGIDYMTQRGYTFEYDNTLPYIVGCIVIDPLDGKTYRNINDVPAGSPNPSLDPTNWVVYDIADYVGGAVRLANYSVGDTSTLLGIPAGYYLECTTAGTTATTAPTVTQPVTAEQTITDGTCVWTVRKCLPTSGGNFESGFCTYTSTDDNGRINIGFGSNGGNIFMFGKSASAPAVTALSSYDGSTASQINLYPDGRIRYYPDIQNTPLTIYKLDEAAIVASSTNGTQCYVKHADGFIVQWGSFILAQRATEATATLPISFTSATSAKIVGSISYTDNTAGVRAINIKLTSGSAIKAITDTGISLGGVGISYIAMGY